MASGQIHRADRIRVTTERAHASESLLPRKKALEGWELGRATTKKRLTKVSHEPSILNQIRPSTRLW
jgi:hypothetical protein